MPMPRRIDAQLNHVQIAVPDYRNELPSPELKLGRISLQALRYSPTLSLIHAEFWTVTTLSASAIWTWSTETFGNGTIMTC